MIRIFISYRRQDNAHAAGRVFDHLTQRLGKEVVFRTFTVFRMAATLSSISNSQSMPRISSWQLSVNVG